MLRKVALALIALAVAGCSRSGAHWGTPGEVRYAFRGDIWTLNPLLAFSQRLIDLTQIYCQPLVAVGPDDRAQPLLVTEIPTRENGGVSADGLTITYHLRHGIRFADGVPFTSKDVAFTYRAVIDPRNPVTEVAPYQRIAALETPDPYTVRIRLKSPWAGAVRELFAESDYIYGILPAHAFGGNTDITHAAWNQHPFGTGPFRVTEWKRGDEVVLERNPYSWQSPKLRRIVMKIIPDQNAALVAMRAHAIDLSDITYAQIAQVKSAHDLALVAIPRNETDELELQTERPAMRDPRVRRAVAAAIDRAAIARSAFFGYAPVATTEIPPLFPEHDASIAPIRYDPQAARALAAAHGAMAPLEIVYSSADQTEREIATMVQADLSRAGIAARLHAYAPSLLYGAAASGGIYYGGRFDIAVTGWFGGLDPESSEAWICANRAPNGPNLARWCDARYDAAFRAQQLATNAAVRTRDFATMQAEIREQLPTVVLVNRTEFAARNPGLRGFAPNMLYDFSQTQDWELR
ncbi:MAG: hypothetical protein KGN02_08765 [bacterium]|nr:hypothetical protein [bacterium]